jgi:alkylated DNA nucleotide flippase Atl1
MSFNEDVFEVVRLIPKGRVTSSVAIAKYLGDARASKGIGWGCSPELFTSFQIDLWLMNFAKKVFR